MAPGNHGDGKQKGVGVAIAQCSGSAFGVSIDDPVHVQPLCQQVAKYHPHALQGLGIGLPDPSLVQQALQSVDIALGIASQSSAQLVRELLYRVALLRHVLPVDGGQGFYLDIEIGVLSQGTSTDQRGTQ